MTIGELASSIDALAERVVLIENTGARMDGIDAEIAAIRDTLSGAGGKGDPGDPGDPEAFENWLEGR